MRNDRYIVRYLSMSLLPTLEEATEDGLERAVTIAGCNPAPVHSDGPKEVPEPQHTSGRYVDKSSETIVEADRDLQAEYRQLRAAVQDAVSQRIVDGNELKKLRKKQGAAEEALKLLWKLATSHLPEFQGVTETAEICNEVRALYHTGGQPGLSAPAKGPRGSRSKDALGRTVARQKRDIEHFKRMEVEWRQKTHWARLHLNTEVAKALIVEEELDRVETKALKAEEELDRVKTRLREVEERARRLEKHLLQQQRVSIAPSRTIS